MPSTAISAQGTSLKLGATGSAKTITGITKANPARVTATAHGFSSGAIVQITGVVGMTEINSRYAMVNVVDANTFDAYGIDSTGFTTYSSGGSATPSQVTVGNLTSYNGPDGQAGDIDITNLASAAKEYLIGLQDNGQISFNVHTDDADQGQIMLLLSRQLQAMVNHVLTLRNGKTRTFMASCKQFAEQGGVDAAIQSSVVCRISGAVVRA